MVSIVHQLGNTEKLDLILAAAQKRLAIYGFEKSTMSEIASDVHLSKASLYYYFPDKESLLHAVLSKEIEEYFIILTGCMDKEQDAEKMVVEFVRMRHEFFTTVLNLTKFRFSNFYQIRPHFRELIENLISRETELFSGVLEKGKKDRIFREDLPPETARLFLEIIHGLRLNVIRGRLIQDLTKEDYDLMFEKHVKFIEMFLRSIKISKY